MEKAVVADDICGACSRANERFVRWERTVRALSKASDQAAQIRFEEAPFDCGICSSVSHCPPSRSPRLTPISEIARIASGELIPSSPTTTTLDPRFLVTRPCDVCGTPIMRKCHLSGGRVGCSKCRSKECYDARRDARSMMAM